MSKGTLEYGGWKQGLPIPDSFFEPTPDIQLIRLSYESYIEGTTKGVVGPAPVLYRHLLHGSQRR